jgi:hypothetical protein
VPLYSCDFLGSGSTWNWGRRDHDCLNSHRLVPVQLVILYIIHCCRKCKNFFFGFSFSLSLCYFAMKLECVLIMKLNRCTNISNFFWNKTPHVSDGSSVHHQEFFTVNTAMVHVMKICWQIPSRIRTEVHS